MEKIKYYIEKYKIILILCFLILVLMIGLIFSIANKKEEKIEETSIVKLEEKIEESEIEIKKFKVDIKGMVENPGVYELDEKSRVIDVINIAGGLKEGANSEYINLSKKIVDEMVIIIYSNDEIVKFKEVEKEKEIIYLEHECKCPDNINNACITKDDTVNTNGVKEELENNNDSLISINNATLEELMTLSGIGESKAKSIIEYRKEKGGFKTLEEIMNVSGIGEAAYSKIKDNIKL